MIRLYNYGCAQYHQFSLECAPVVLAPPPFLVNRNVSSFENLSSSISNNNKKKKNARKPLSIVKDKSEIPSVKRMEGLGYIVI